MRLMKLKELREMENLTQEEFASKHNITRTTYANYESGKTQPDFNILFQIADYYKISLDYLLGHENKSEFDLGYLNNDQKTAIKMLTTLNHINFIKAFSYISGLYASQN